MKKSVDETTLEFFIDKLKHTLLINIQTSRLQISNAYLSELCEELFEKAFLYKYEEKNNENNKSTEITEINNIYNSIIEMNRKDKLLSDIYNEVSKNKKLIQHNFSYTYFV